MYFNESYCKLTKGKKKKERRNNLKIQKTSNACTDISYITIYKIYKF